MAEFERNYRAGRSVVGLVSIFGWCVVLLGAMVAGVALVSLLRSGDALSAMAQLMAIAVGAGVALAGLVAVAAAQHMAATFDVADISREMLSLARRRPTPAVPAVGASFGSRNDLGVNADAPRLSTSPTSSRRGGSPALHDRSEFAPIAEPLAAEPRLSAPARPTSSDARAHPIFRARPPR